jgi:3',5'-cyclic AMP phosphodiesterase CpdA
VRELVSVGPTYAETFIDGEVRQHRGLAPDTDHVIDGLAVRTLPDVGPVLSTVVTMNDVHFGEVECGKIEGVVAAAFVVEDGERPYPEVMNESVIEDASALHPGAVIVKGDLTSFGTLEEYATFRQFYEPVFGDRLTYVRGNHDSYPGLVFADWEIQVVDVPGLRVVLLDTSRSHQTFGSVSESQVEATCDAVADTDECVIVMGHHPLFVHGLDRVGHFDGVGPSDSERLLAALSERPQVVAYAAGHTHRCRRADVGGVAVVEVACVKDFPGAFAEYVVGEHGVAQVLHRASSPKAVAWAEKTRTMFDGYYGTYAMGRLEDRSFWLPRRRDN